MIIEKVSISEIHDAEYNPRVKLFPGDRQYEAIKRSIEEFGLVYPIVVNKRTGNVISGHQRISVLKELGFKQVEASIVDVDEQTEKQLNLALNKISGEWEKDKLRELLEQMENVEITGFTEQELAELFNSDFGIESVKQDDTDVYSVTISFEKDEKRKVEDYISENGKNRLCDVIAELSKKWEGGEQ